MGKSQPPGYKIVKETEVLLAGLVCFARGSALSPCYDYRVKGKAPRPSEAFQNLHRMCNLKHSIGLDYRKNLHSIGLDYRKKILKAVWAVEIGLHHNGRHLTTR